MSKNRKAKNDMLRLVLEAIYWAATDGGYFASDEGLLLEDLPKVASAVDKCLLPKGREYLAGIECAPYFATIDKLTEHLRGNLGPEWGMDGRFEE